VSRREEEEEEEGAGKGLGMGASARPLLFSRTGMGGGGLVVAMERALDPETPSHHPTQTMNWKRKPAFASPLWRSRPS
jgi:hypothetical protein